MQGTGREEGEEKSRAARQQEKYVWAGTSQTFLNGGVLRRLIRRGIEGTGPLGRIGRFGAASPLFDGGRDLNVTIAHCL